MAVNLKEKKQRWTRMNKSSDTQSLVRGQTAFQRARMRGSITHDTTLSNIVGKSASDPWVVGSEDQRFPAESPTLTNWNKDTVDPARLMTVTLASKGERRGVVAEKLSLVFTRIQRCGEEVAHRGRELGHREREVGKASQVDKLTSDLAHQEDGRVSPSDKHAAASNHEWHGSRLREMRMSPLAQRDILEIDDESWARHVAKKRREQLDFLVARVKRRHGFELSPKAVRGIILPADLLASLRFVGVSLSVAEFPEVWHRICDVARRTANRRPRRVRLNETVDSAHEAAILKEDPDLRTLLLTFDDFYEWQVEYHPVLKAVDKGKDNVLVKNADDELFLKNYFYWTPIHDIIDALRTLRQAKHLTATAAVYSRAAQLSLNCQDACKDACCPESSTWARANGCCGKSSFCI